MSIRRDIPIWVPLPDSGVRVSKPLMTNRLRTLRLRAKLSQTELAERMGTTRSQYVKLERGDRRLTEEWIRRAADALGVSPGALIEDGTVPLIGVVGGRGVVELLTSQERAAAPPETSPGMAAINVTGAALGGVADEGWTIYFDNSRRPASGDLAGALCVVGLPDGSILVRKIALGRTPGLYHLHLPGADPIFDQPLQWAARVAWIRPRT